MPRPPDHERRQELLDAVLDDVAARGIGGRSLRDLATAVGTSHRMLIHHFGSRDGVLVAVVEKVERRQRVAFGALPADPSAAFRTMWRQLSDPRLRPFERLFFECYARGAQGEQPFARLVPGAVTGWLDEIAAHPTGGSAAAARLGLAVTRGLLLDLAATDDQAGVDAAAEVFAAILGDAR